VKKKKRNTKERKKLYFASVMLMLFFKKKKNRIHAQKKKTYIGVYKHGFYALFELSSANNLAKIP
jgi:ABC-type uncharacterized transport system substrate-binding protein